MSIEAMKQALEYADARWSGVDVPIEWLRHFVNALPQRQWVGLTDDEMETVWAETWSYDQYAIPRAIEAKLKEKNT